MPRQYFKQIVGPHFADRLVAYASQQDFGFCFRGNGWGKHVNHQFDAFAGFGIYQKSDANSCVDFVSKSDDYVINAISYDYKNALEDLTSENPDGIGLEPMIAYVPKITIRVNGRTITCGFRDELFEAVEAKSIVDDITKTQVENKGISTEQAVPKARITREEYLTKIESCKKRIKRGDIYQANICQEFFWEGCTLNPAQAFIAGTQQNPNPFSVYLKHGQIHALSWSPERFISVDGNKVLSQPMKGTAPRNKDESIDIKNRKVLASSEKDRRENVMIVDMVRNDLSAYAMPGSVKTPELYVVKTYPQVHQMHSTVMAEIKKDTPLLNVILAAFPMASMTGAPKINAMKIIDKIEETKRGLYSGTIGFITPDKKADYNVVIRSLMYCADKKYLSCQVGGGITDLSVAASELEECHIKLAPIQALVSSLRN